MKLYIFLFFLMFSKCTLSAPNQSDWGGVCNFMNKHMDFEFRSLTRDSTNDDMYLTIDGKAIDIPKGWYHSSYTYFEGKKTLCSGGIIAFEYGDYYVVAASKDGRPNNDFVVFIFYDAVHNKVIDFIDPSINIQYSADHDGYPLVMKFKKGRYFFRGVSEIITDPDNDESKIFLDGWFELQVLNNKLIVKKP